MMPIKQVYQSYLEPVIVFLSHIGFMVLMASLPLSKGTSSVTMVIMLGFSAMLWAFSDINLPKLIRQNKMAAWLVLLFFAYIAGLFYSEHLQGGSRFVYKQSALLWLPFIVLINRNLVKNYGTFYLKWLIWGTCFAALVTTGLYLLPDATLLQIAPQLPHWGLLRLPEVAIAGKFGFYSPFIDRLSFSYILGLSVLSCCWLAISGNMYKPVAWVLLCLLLFTSAILGGRGAQLGLLVSLLIWLAYIANNMALKLINKSSLLLKTLLAVSVVFFGIFAAYGIFKTMPSVWDRYDQLQWEMAMFKNNTYKEYDYRHFTTLRRLYSWQNSWELIKQHPLTGVGTGDYRPRLQQLYNLNQPGFEANAHNQFLQIWATLGIGGLLLFVGLLGYFLRKMYGVRQRGLHVFGISVIVFYGIIFTFDSPLNTQVSLMTFVLLMCLLPLVANRYNALP